MEYKEIVKNAINLGSALMILVLLSELQVAEAATTGQCSEPVGVDYLNCPKNKKATIQPSSITCQEKYKFRKKGRKAYKVPNGADYISITELSIPDGEEVFVSEVTCPNNKCRVLRLRPKAEGKTPILNIELQSRKFEISTKKKKGTVTFQCSKDPLPTEEETPTNDDRSGEDINVCDTAEANASCPSEGGTCVDLGSTWRCDCNEGWQHPQDGDDRTCESLECTNRGGDCWDNDARCCTGRMVHYRDNPSVCGIPTKFCCLPVSGGNQEGFGADEGKCNARHQVILEDEKDNYDLNGDSSTQTSVFSQITTGAGADMSKIQKGPSCSGAPTTCLKPRALNLLQCLHYTCGPDPKLEIYNLLDNTETGAKAEFCTGRCMTIRIPAACNDVATTTTLKQMCVDAGGVVTHDAGGLLSCCE